MEFSGLTGCAAPAFNAGAITTEETSALSEMRKAIGPLPEGALAEVSSDFFFLRFLRGYQSNLKAATEAYRAMLEYRAEGDLNAVHTELCSAGMPWPWDMERFAQLRVVVGERGILRLHTHDLQGNVLTHCLAQPALSGIRAAVKAGLGETYLELFRYLDEWMLVKTHALCTERGHLVGEHQIIDVDGVGMFSFGGVLDTVRAMGKGSRHYPERLVHIDDINNTRVAMFIWPAIAPFIPKHTASKLRVAGRAFQETLLAQIAETELPPSLGGACSDARWVYVTEK
jgi:hypothetical protein